MKKHNKILYFFYQLIILLLIIYIFATCVSYGLCINAAKNLPEHQAQEVLRIKIYGSTNTSTNNTVSGTFSLMDSNGYEIATIERSWRGAYLAVEFAEIKLFNKFFLFPCRIYGKNNIIEEPGEIKNGTTLDKYYNDNKQCMLLGHGSTYEQRKDMYWLSTYAMKKYHLFDFGLVENYSIDLSDCKPDRYYSISTDSNGNVFISEL